MDNTKKIKDLIAKMSLQQKALLCSGRKFWFTRGIADLGIEPYMVCDGPHGLRKQRAGGGINDSIEATCFPAACTMASSWDIELIAGVGKRIGEEALQEGVGIVLGPGANIKRSPLCGRNFEYYSEDPYLSGNIAGAFIGGLQTTGVGASLKHYAVNNQETDRMRVDAVVDERALREIYLASFEYAVKIGCPYTIMCAYNRINGEFASESRKLCQDILRGEWGFDGYVMTDWGAINDRVKGLKSGIDLEMPGGSGESVKDIVDAVQSGALDEDVLDTAVARLLKINFAVNQAKQKDYIYDIEEHHAYARKVAGEGAVLLKNQDSILPLAKDKNFVAIGGLCKTPRYQGSGSSLIRPNKLVSPYDALKQQLDFAFAEGYKVSTDKADAELVAQAVELCRNTDAPIVIFAGLTIFYESEGFDREHLSLPHNQNELIDKLAELGKDIIVVLYGGAPVEMPWINKVKAVLNMYLPGQASGEATADLLFGDINPSGKLAESYPLSLDDTPCRKYFPQGPRTVEYRESIFVGYRYYDTAKKEVLYPFGHGLSYAKFEYSNIAVDKKELKSGEALQLSFDITNIGDRYGKEAAQVYVSNKSGRIFRAEKELKAFAKVALAPGETKQVSITLDARDFCYYNVDENGWRAEGGTYNILVGASSRDIRLSASVNVQAKMLPSPYVNKKIADYMSPSGSFSDAAFAEVLGHKPPSNVFPTRPVDGDFSAAENRISLFGKLFGFVTVKGATLVVGGKDENAKLMRHFVQAMIKSNSLRSIATSNGGMLSKGAMDGLIDAFNKHFFRGMGKTIKALIQNKKYDKELLAIEGFDYKIKP